MTDGESLVSRAMPGTLDAAAIHAPIPFGFQMKSRAPESKPGVSPVSSMPGDVWEPCHDSLKKVTVQRIAVPLPLPFGAMIMVLVREDMPLPTSGQDSRSPSTAPSAQ